MVAASKKVGIKQVMLDTNALVFSVQNKVDFVSRITEMLEGCNFEFIIPSGVVDELQMMINSKSIKTKDKLSAGISLKLISGLVNQRKIKVVDSDLPVDDWMIKQAKLPENKGRLAVFTYDRPLKQYLKKLGVQLILLKKY